MGKAMNITSNVICESLNKFEMVGGGWREGRMGWRERERDRERERERERDYF